ncbi:MAG: DUF2087 domain-containing protein [Ruminococcaceae bacterium]|nr:DUF2087 domain-containing protein [Oscillospiraceae bacterium]
MNNEQDIYDIPTLKTGLLHTADGHTTCLTCGARFEPDEVYPCDGHYYTAAKAAAHHAQTAHGSRLAHLMETGGKYVTLTDHQKKLLALLAEGKSDAEIAAETGAAASTMRRQRFMFREKAKRARMYLALYELATETRQHQADTLLPVPSAFTAPDDRFVITQKESDQYVKNAFESLAPLRLRALPAKEKKKVAVLHLIARQFEKGTDYTEQQVNAILKDVHPDDYVTLRRYLIEYGYLGRTPNGSRYWVTQ